MLESVGSDIEGRLTSPSSFQLLFASALAEAVNGSQSHLKPGDQPLLNGAAYRAFRESFKVEHRRGSGAFFSGPAIAQELASSLYNVLPSNSVVADPTCGVGDLLLAYARLLPIEASLNETLRAWGERIVGIDINPDFVNFAKVRLIALARSRGGFGEPLPDFRSVFPKIVAANMFDQLSLLKDVDGVLLNPPFVGTTDHKVAWAKGRINSAAVFLEAVIKSTRSQAPIAAVLPEVLRCGSRYSVLRYELESSGFSGEFASQGQFDTWTDVDVFTTLILASKGKLWSQPTPSGAKVSDYFDVKVGPVVPHRHENKGPWRRYICAKSVPRWSTGFEPTSSRRFAGTVFQPPFVVVRRTSSPSDRKRAVGAIIVGDRPVAVENHLLVIEPKLGSVAACEELLSVLNADATSTFLNERIRCRHLTTGSVMAIPWNMQ